MLRSLSIQNFALIDQLDLDFQEGLNAITGETGAGKTILLQALGLLSGNKCESYSIRNKNEKLCVEAMFEIDANDALKTFIEEIGLDEQELDGELLIRREVSPGGKSKMSLNGRLLRLSDAKALAEILYNIHSQHDTAHLLQAQLHPQLLREFGDESIRKTYLDYSQAYRELLDLRRKKDGLVEKTQKILRERDRLELELQEIAQVAPCVEEEARIHSAHQRLVHLMEIMHLLDQAERSMDASEEGSFGYGLNSLIHDIQSIERLDKEARLGSEISNQLDSQVQELKSFLSDYRSSLEHDESLSLDEVEQRIAEFEGLKRKYGSTLQEVLEYEKQNAERLFELKDESTQLEKIDELIEKQVLQGQKLALSLSKGLKKLAKSLESQMDQVLARLSMKGSSFQVLFRPNTQGYGLAENEFLSENGLEEIEFYLRANEGSEALPLAKCASGGEVSRVMLALKRVFVNTQSASTFVFDEIDTGIGGHTAHRLAEVIHEISTKKQVFVITHLPQIASRATQHYLVEKLSQKGNTESRVRLLGSDERKLEIARMMGIELENQDLPTEMATILQNSSN